MAAPGETATPAGVHQTLGLPDTGKMEMRVENPLDMELEPGDRQGGKEGGEGGREEGAGGGREGGREVGGMSAVYRSPSDTKGVLDPFVYRIKAEGEGGGEGGSEKKRVVRAEAGEVMPPSALEDGWAALMNGLGGW